MLFENKKLKITFQYIIPVITIVGLLKQLMFYATFKIQINDFMDFSEIIMTLIEPNYFIGVTFISVLGLIFINISGYKIGKNNTNKFDKLKTLKSTERFAKLFKDWLFYINIFICIEVIYLLIFSKKEFYEFVYILNMPAYSIINYFLVEIRIARINNELEDFDTTYLNIFQLGVGIIFITFLQTSSDIEKIKRHYKYYNTQISLTNNYVMISDSINTYVGKTTNYCFFYNLKTHNSTVIPTSEVKEYKFVIND